MGKKAKARKARQAKEAIERFYWDCWYGDLKGVHAALQGGLDVRVRLRARVKLVVEALWLR